jgi:Tol biopolymer transport system component
VLFRSFSTAGNESVAHELSWSPPAMNHYVYSANAAAQDYDLYLDSNTPLAQASGADGGAAWSPDGTKIAFTSARTGQGDLYLLDTTNPTKAPLRLSGDPVASELYASWAPDSRRIVFVGHTPTGDNLYLIDNVDFPGPKAITSWAHTQTRPRFSPDGTMIAFYSNHTSPDRFDLYVMKVGGTPTLVANDVELNNGGPAWSPDSKDLVYVKRDPNHFSPVWAAPVAAPNNAKVIETGTVGNGDLDVIKRPDGRAWIALAAQGRTGDAVRDFKRIYVMALPALP